MRYRIFQKDMFLGAFDDRSTFYEAFAGDNPNSPMKGDKIRLDSIDYKVKWYIEHDSESFTENEFHEKDQDWFADIIVE